jgi:proteic killer suppression protein
LAVEVSFATAKLARLCSSMDRMVRELGPGMARRLGARLQELEAAASLAELRTLPQVRAHELRGDRDEQISLDLVHPQRLILQATPPAPRTAEGGLDWEAITSVTVIEIADTHQ